MAGEITSTMDQILSAREERSRIQDRLLVQYKKPLISFTMNIPGPVKNADWISQSFEYGKEDLLAYFSSTGIRLVDEEETPAGPEAFFIIENTTDNNMSDAFAIKKMAVLFEQQHAAGRWYDVDVRSSDGRFISREQIGAAERKCFICGRSAKLCGRSRQHTAEELFQFTRTNLQHYLLQKDHDPSDC